MRLIIFLAETIALINDNDGYIGQKDGKIMQFRLRNNRLKTTALHYEKGKPPFQHYLTHL